MDQKTRDQRRRNKELANKRGELPSFEPRGLGRKNKRHETFPQKRCDHIDGGRTITFRKRRKDGTTYLVSIIKGGIRCPKTAPYGTKCPAHSGGPTT